VSSTCIVSSEYDAHRGVALLGLAGLLREDDQSAPVLLEPLDVDLLALLGPSVPPVVDDDTQTLGLLLGDTSLLQLGKSETSAEPDLGVVSLSGSSDSGSEKLERSDSESEGLLLTSDTPGVLSAGLVEPGLDTLLLRKKGINVRVCGQPSGMIVVVSSFRGLQSVVSPPSRRLCYDASFGFSRYPRTSSIRLSLKSMHECSYCFARFPS